MNTQIAAAYLGCKYIMDYGKEEPQEMAVNGETITCCERFPNAMLTDVLILKPLTKISQEHALEVAKILNDQSDEGLYDQDDFDSWMEEIWSGNCATFADYVSGRQFQQIIDFLRPNSYDCGFGTIESLIKSGDAIERE